MRRKIKSQLNKLKNFTRATRRSRTRKVGLAPGTLVYVGEKKTDKTTVTATDYDPDNYREFRPESVEECLPLKESKSASWINIDGLHEVELIGKYGEAFGLHPLVQEDILDTGQMPKMDYHAQQLFVILKGFHESEDQSHLETEQISLVLGPGYVLTFQERPDNFLEGLKKRIASSPKTRIRSMGSSYLAYAIIDYIVDSYFITLEQLEERVDRLEERLIRNPVEDILGEIYHLKRELLFFRKIVWPVRLMVSDLSKMEMPILGPQLEPFLHDLYDHLVHLVESIDTLREVITGLHETHQAAIGNRLNKVMHLLTIVATIFIPLTFIAGIYGMNFQYMPELDWPWGYPMVLGVMIGLALVMLGLFKWKRWL
jgi:magnesium transporter